MLPDLKNLLGGAFLRHQVHVIAIGGDDIKNRLADAVFAQDAIDHFG